MCMEVGGKDKKNGRSASHSTNAWPEDDSTSEVYSQRREAKLDQIGDKSDKRRGNRKAAKCADDGAYMKGTERRERRSLLEEGAQGDLERLEKSFNELGVPLHPKLGSAVFGGFGESSGDPEVLRSHLEKSFAFWVESYVGRDLTRRRQEQFTRFEDGKLCRKS
ncbi:hypothetical protein K438DRAFT_1755428 [Mycena galopus ATCC 62051]|nr:hypothetical protein K438DRAFT_1755428 [Mycena galopus ATCC 62051]